MNNRQESLTPVLLAAIFFIGAAASWNHLYVKPHDEFRFSMINCMNKTGNHSLEGYKSCIDIVKEEKNDH